MSPNALFYSYYWDFKRQGQSGILGMIFMRFFIIYFFLSLFLLCIIELFYGHTSFIAVPMTTATLLIGSIIYYVSCGRYKRIIANHEKYDKDVNRAIMRVAILCSFGIGEMGFLLLFLRNVINSHS